MATSLPSPSLTETLKALPEDATLYDAQNGNHFLRFDPLKSWNCSHKCINAAEKPVCYKLIADELCLNGLGEIATQDQRVHLIQNINSFFSSIPAPHALTLPKEGEAIYIERDQGDFSWLHPKFRTLIVRESGEVFPSIRADFDSKRLLYAHSDEVLDKLKLAYITQKKVDSIVDEYLESNPSNQYDDHRMINLMEESLDLAYRQNPALRAGLKKTEPFSLIYKIPAHEGIIPLHEFAQDRFGKEKGSLFGQDPEDLGRNWLGSCLEKLRGELLAEEVVEL